MKTFEIHITGDKNILSLKDNKTISIDLLKPDGSLFKTEYMTSDIKKYISGFEAIKRTIELSKNISDLGIKIERIKVECPPYEEYFKDSTYIESHFSNYKGGWCKLRDDIFYYPTSKNQNKSEFLGTSRIYNKEKYQKFIENNRTSQIELCIFDIGINDDEWFKFYEDLS